MAESRLYRTEAVVIRRQDFGEADKVITVFTPHRGKLRLIAKGVRKTTSRLGGHVELFVRAQLLIARGRNLDIVTQAETVDPYFPLRARDDAINHAWYCAELLDRLTELQQESYPAWELLLATLRRLGTARSSALARQYFTLQLLAILGFRPQLSECVKCGEPLAPVPNFISASAGGALCPACGRQVTGSRPLSVNALKVLRAILRGEWTLVDRLRAEPALLAELDGTLEALVHHVAERDLRSSELLRAVPPAESPRPSAAATG